MEYEFLSFNLNNFSRTLLYHDSNINKFKLPLNSKSYFFFLTLQFFDK